MTDVAVLVCLGSRFGLRLLLNVEEYDQIEQNTAGVKVS